MTPLMSTLPIATILWHLSSRLGFPHIWVPNQFHQSLLPCIKMALIRIFGNLMRPPFDFRQSFFLVIRWFRQSHFRFLDLYMCGFQIVKLVWLLSSLFFNSIWIPDLHYNGLPNHITSTMWNPDKKYSKILDFYFQNLSDV
jgi:hypothetical protein